MNSSRKIIILTILLALASNIFGQSNSGQNEGGDIFYKLESKDEGMGEVVIFQDMRINELIYHSIERNKQRGTISGFRIFIFSNLGNKAREQSQAAKTKFYELFPEIPIYRGYESPYFKVYVGDYRTRIDAMKDFKQIKRYFPSAYIVPRNIRFPELEN